MSKTSLMQKTFGFLFALLFLHDATAQATYPELPWPPWAAAVGVIAVFAVAILIAAHVKK